MNDGNPILEQVDTTKNIVVTRRSFFGTLLGLGSLGMGAILAVPVLRYVLYPLYSKAAGTGWSDVGDVSEFSGSKEPVLKTITFKQRDGWREVVTTQSVYELMLMTTSSSCSPLSVLTWVAVWVGNQVDICFIALAMVVNSSPTACALQARPQGAWTNYRRR
jgi:hypothetical protein